MKVLFIGSHCDDIELGCGATIHKFKNEWDIFCFVLGGNGTHLNRQDLFSFSEKSLVNLGVVNYEHCHDFIINCFELERQRIWEILSRIQNSYKPDLIFTHYPDEQQDHCTVYRETLRCFKKESILLYQSSRYNCPSFIPNTYYTVDKNDLEVKKKSLSFYEMYNDKIYFKPENIESILRWNGLYLNAELAEGFVVHRLVDFIRR